jgi:hypothetical protein
MTQFNPTSSQLIHRNKHTPKFTNLSHPAQPFQFGSFSSVHRRWRSALDWGSEPCCSLGHKQQRRFRLDSGRCTPGTGGWDEDTTGSRSVAQFKIRKAGAYARRDRGGREGSALKTSWAHESFRVLDSPCRARTDAGLAGFARDGRTAARLASGDGRGLHVRRTIRLPSFGTSHFCASGGERSALTRAGEARQHVQCADAPLSIGLSTDECRRIFALKLNSMDTRSAEFPYFTTN